MSLDQLRVLITKTKKKKKKNTHAYIHRPTRAIESIKISKRYFLFLLRLLYSRVSILDFIRVHFIAYLYSYLSNLMYIETLHLRWTTVEHLATVWNVQVRARQIIKTWIVRLWLYAQNYTSALIFFPLSLLIRSDIDFEPESTHIFLSI